MKKTRVIIVGAGCAGLGAAQALRERGIPFTVLEARNRVGGRVFPWSGWGPEIDLGASWLHSAKDNVLARLLGIDHEDASDGWDLPQLWDCDGYCIPARDVARLKASWDRLLEAADNRALPSKSLAEILYADLKEKEGFDRRVLDWFVDVLSTVHGDDSEFLSSSFYNEEGHTQNRKQASHDLMLKQSYAPILQHLSSGIPVQFGCIVQSIVMESAGSGSAICLYTNHGPIYGSHVIVTVPLSLLKAHAIEFSPKLPSLKEEAISRLGMGLVNRFIVSCEEQWWPDSDPSFFGFLGQDKPQIPQFIPYNNVIGVPLLVGIAGGESARHFESWKNEELLTYIHALFQKWWGSHCSAPRRVLSSRWLADPWSQGSYSYIPPSSSPQDREELSRPVASKIFFAGEAVHREHAATTHGAYLSGIQAVDDLCGHI